MHLAEDMHCAQVHSCVAVVAIMLKPALNLSFQSGYSQVPVLPLTRLTCMLTHHAHVGVPSY